MKALTVRQPFAALLATGAKQVEFRDWPTEHRGPLAIHAGVRRHALWREVRHLHPGPLASVTGAIVGVVDVVDCVPAPPYGWAWIVRRATPLASPIPWKGGFGLFDVPDEVFAAQV